jgi:hypothetical protein
MPHMTFWTSSGRTTSLLAWAWLTISLSSSLACSLTINADRVQCRSDGDCTSRGPEFADSVCIGNLCQVPPAWACLDTAPTPSTELPPYPVKMHAVDLISRAPVPNVSAQLCRKIDVDCAMPVATATSDSAGSFMFSIDANFSGYVTLLNDAYVPTLYFFNPAVDRAQEIPPISLASPFANAGLLLQLGRQALPDRGNVVVQSFDCTGQPAADVRYSTPSGDEMTAPFYTVDGLPTATATATDKGGYGGVINLPMGSATVVATLTKPMATLATISVLVRSGAITYTQVAANGR